MAASACASPEHEFERAAAPAKPARVVELGRLPGAHPAHYIEHAGLACVYVNAARPVISCAAKPLPRFE